MKVTEHEREFAVARLESSRDKLLAAIDGVTEDQANFKPAPDRWSILQLVEHLATSDPGLMSLIQKALASPAQPELVDQVHKHDRRFMGELKPLPRGVNKAPEFLQPKSAYSKLEEAKEAFLKHRAATIEYARTTQDDLRDHFAQHNVLGPMDGYQWLVACAVHVESHTLQIEEIRTILSA
jgi:uncharacterized damage-inducible protein DinB